MFEQDDYRSVRTAVIACLVLFGMILYSINVEYKDLVVLCIDLFSIIGLLLAVYVSVFYSEKRKMVFVKPRHLERSTREEADVGFSYNDLLSSFSQKGMVVFVQNKNVLEKPVVSLNENGGIRSIVVREGYEYEDMISIQKAISNLYWKV